MDRLGLIAILAVILVLIGEVLLRKPVSVLVPDGSTYQCGPAIGRWERTDIWQSDAQRLFDSVGGNPDADYFDYPAFTCHDALDRYEGPANVARLAGGVLLVGVLFGLFRRWVTGQRGSRPPGAPSLPLSAGQKLGIVLLPVWSIGWVGGRVWAAAWSSDPISGRFFGLEGLLLLIGIGVIVSGIRHWPVIAGATTLAVAGLVGIDAALPSPPTGSRSPATVAISATDRFSSFEFDAMAATDEALIAIAWPGVAVTEDLPAWRFANFAPEDENYGDWLVTVNAVTSWSQGLVAAGVDQHDYQPIVWHYRTDHFERTEVEPRSGLGGYLGDIAQFREGLVAVGAVSEFGSGAMLVWISPDGASWTRIEVPGEGTLSQVTAGPHGLVALGRFLDDELDDLHAFALVSSNGEIWTRLELPVTTAFLKDLTTTPFGYVAVGHNGQIPEVAVIFISPDGRTWSQVPTNALGESTRLWGITTIEDWTYAAGDGVFASKDGLTWTQLDPTGSFNSVTTFGGKVIAAEKNRIVELPYPPLPEE